MALPTSMGTATFRTPTGVELGIHPSTEGRFPIEIRRSTQSSTSSTAWFTHGLDPSSGAFRYMVPLPLSTRSYFFQARHVGVGYSNGAYSPVVSAKPVKLSLGGSVPIVRGKNAAVEIPLGDLWLTSGQTAKVGTQATTATVEKILFVPFSAFQPDASSGVSAIYAANYLTQRINVVSNYHAPVILPPLSRVTNITLRGYRATATTATICQTILQRTSDNISITQIATVTKATTGWGNHASTSFSETISTGRQYDLLAALKTNATTDSARVGWVKITYRMPTYKVGL